MQGSCGYVQVFVQGCMSNGLNPGCISKCRGVFKGQEGTFKRDVQQVISNGVCPRCYVHRSMYKGVYLQVMYKGYVQASISGFMSKGVRGISG